MCLSSSFSLSFCLLRAANLSDPEARSFTVKGFSLGTYKFTVKAYTSVGEDTGATASIMLRIRTWTH